MFKSINSLHGGWTFAMSMLALAYGTWAAVSFYLQLAQGDRGMAMFVAMILGPVIWTVVTVLVYLSLGAVFLLIENTWIRALLISGVFGYFVVNAYIIPSEKSKKEAIRQTHARELEKQFSEAEERRQQREAEAHAGLEDEPEQPNLSAYERLKSDMLQERDHVPYAPADTIPEQLQVEDLSGKKTHYRITNISPVALDIQVNTVHTGADALDVVARHAYLPNISDTDAADSGQQKLFRLQPAESAEVALPDQVAPGLLEFELWDQKAGQYGKFVFKSETAFVPVAPER